MKGSVGRFALRAVIAAVVFAVGFQAERYYQAKLAEESRSAVSDGTFPIVLLGGSIAVGLAAAVQSYLAPSLGANVVEANAVMLASDQVAAKVEEIIAKHRPKVILVQVGLSEPTRHGSEWMSMASGLISSRDARSLSEMVAAALRSDRPEDVKLVFKLFVAEREAILDAGFAPVLSRVVDARLGETVDRIGDSPKIVSEIETLVALGGLISNLEKAGSAKTALGASPEEKAAWVRTAFERLVRAAKEWPERISSLGAKRFLESEERSDFYLRHWFYATWYWASRSGEKDAVAHLSRNTESIMRVFGWALSHAKDPEVSALLGRPEPRRLWDSIVAYGGKAQFEIYHDGSTFDSSDMFRENLRKVAVTASAGGARLVLLQYPNRDLEMVTAAGRDLGILVVENGRIFDDKIAERGRAAWFIDEIGTTGHLTEEGLNFFGRHVAERLNQELAVAR